MNRKKMLWLWVVLAFFLWAQMSYWFEWMTEEIFLDMWLEYSTTIWCMNNLTSYIPELNSKKEMICKDKKMILPKREELKIFVDKYFTIVDTEYWKKKVCYEDCLRKIANRFWIINFESWFNKDLISKTNDYWYVQMNWRKEFLWKVKESLDELDRRFQDHTTSICKNIYHVNLEDHRSLYKCLAMRHNWQKNINSFYSKRALAWSDFYFDYFIQKIKEKHTEKTLHS